MTKIYKKTSAKIESPETIAIRHLGEWIDKSDNALAWLTNPFAPNEMRLGALESFTRTLRKEMLDLYLAFGGVNEWEHTP